MEQIKLKDCPFKGGGGSRRLERRSGTAVKKLGVKWRGLRNGKGLAGFTSKSVRDVGIFWVKIDVFGDAVCWRGGRWGGVLEVLVNKKCFPVPEGPSMQCMPSIPQFNMPSPFWGSPELAFGSLYRVFWRNERKSGGFQAPPNNLLTFGRKSERTEL
jgi:hypothetical protein